jgi:hypothetical protein
MADSFSEDVSGERQRNVVRFVEVVKRFTFDLNNDSDGRRLKRKEAAPRGGLLESYGGGFRPSAAAGRP